MKKLMSIISVCFLLVAMLVVVASPVSAATPKEQIIAAAKANVPAKYLEKQLPTLENILQQIEVTPEQAEKVVANIEAAKAAILEDKGDSLSEYSPAEIKAVLKEIDAACNTLGLTYEFKPAANPQHEGDVDCVIKVNNKIIATLDGDAVKKTNVADSSVNYGLILLAAVFAAAAVVVAVRGKKAVVSR